MTSEESRTAALKSIASSLKNIDKNLKILVTELKPGKEDRHDRNAAEQEQ